MLIPSATHKKSVGKFIYFPESLEEYAHLLRLIHWIDKDRTVVVACENVVENFCGKFKNAALGNQEIQPGMWNLP